MDVFETLWQWGNKLAYELFPLSPFRPYLDQMADLPHLSYLNWFFPIGDGIKITAAWLSAISIYYTWMVLFRWLKIIGD